MCRCGAHNICSSHLRTAVCQVVAAYDTMVTLSHKVGSGIHPVNINTRNTELLYLTNIPHNRQSGMEGQWRKRQPGTAKLIFHKQHFVHKGLYYFTFKLAGILSFVVWINVWSRSTNRTSFLSFSKRSSSAFPRI